MGLTSTNSLFRKPSENEASETQQWRYFVSPKIGVPNILICGTFWRPPEPRPGNPARGSAGRLAECSHPGAGERERHPAMGPRGGAAGYGKRTAQTACRYLRILRQAALLAPLPVRQETH
jgi:hypothetical protein